MMDFLILILFVSSLTSAAFGQDETRGNGEKVGSEGRGQARTIHSPRNQFMHFGKRPETLQPPKIPFTINIELARGQTLESVPEEVNGELSGLQYVDSLMLPMNNHQNLQYRVLEPQLQQQLLPSIFNHYEVPAPRWFAPSKPAQPSLRKLISSASSRTQPEKLLRLISSSSNDESELNGNEENAERAQNSSNQSADQQADNINLNTRSSMQSGVNKQNGLLLPDQIYSHLYYSRQPSRVSIPNFGAYNKKAEPKDNFFMHFG